MDYIHSVRELIDMREVQDMDLSLSSAGFSLYLLHAQLHHSLVDGKGCWLHV